METECGPDVSSEGTKTRRREGKVRKSKKGRSARPRSPEEGRTSFMMMRKIVSRGQKNQICIVSSGFLFGFF